MARLPRSLSLALVVVAVAGCGGATKINGIDEPLRGPITDINSRQVCIGDVAATGDCFDAAPKQLTGLQPDDCVEAHWKLGSAPGAGPDILISIKRVDGKAPDC